MPERSGNRFWLADTPGNSGKGYSGSLMYSPSTIGLTCKTSKRRPAGSSVSLQDVQKNFPFSSSGTPSMACNWNSQKISERKYTVSLSTAIIGVRSSRIDRNSAQASCSLEIPQCGCSALSPLLSSKRSSSTRSNSISSTASVISPMHLFHI